MIRIPPLVHQVFNEEKQKVLNSFHGLNARTRIQSIKLLSFESSFLFLPHPSSSSQIVGLNRSDGKQKAPAPFFLFLTRVASVSVQLQQGGG